MTDAISGQPVTLLSQWYAYEDGPLTDLDSTPTITISNVGSGAVVVGPTASGVTHPGTGSYGFVWTPSASLAPGLYLVTWNGTASAVAVAAAETVTLIAVSSLQPPEPSDKAWYCTRETVKALTDIKLTGRSNQQVDQAIAAASRKTEGLLHRVLYPRLGVRYFDWPNFQYAYPWRIWFDQWELITPMSVTTGGQTIPLTACNFEPYNTAAPYQYLELRRDLSYSFGVGPTPQRDVAIVGLWGYRNDETAAGTATATATASAETLLVSDSSAIGVGQIVRAGAERLIVTEKSMTTTGQTLQAPLTANKNDQAVHVTTGSAYSIGEVLLLDSERVRVDDIAGNILTVERAWDGTTLAAHTGSTVYAPRSLTVVRGALGTTADTIVGGAQLYRWEPPSGVAELTAAEASVTLLQGAAGYARQTGVGSVARKVGGGTVTDTSYGVALDALRGQVYTQYGRKARSRSI